jgi:hypothetical protein
LIALLPALIFSRDAVYLLTDLPISINDFSCFSRSVTQDASPSDTCTNPIDFSLIPNALASASAFACASFYAFYYAKDKTFFSFFIYFVTFLSSFVFCSTFLGVYLTSAFFSTLYFLSSTFLIYFYS